MKNKILRNTVFLLVLGTLAGCGGKSLSPEDFEIAAKEIAHSVPLVVERSAGVTIRPNVFREEHGISTVPVLKDGNNLTLITEGTLKFEDEDEGIDINTKFKVDWSYLQNENYGTFEFDKDKAGNFAIPGYPIYEPEFDAGGNEIHVVPEAKAARLYAIIKIGKMSKSFSFDMIFEPQMKIEIVPLIEVRELPLGEVIGVRGYVTGVFPDWNTAGIVDGETGLGIYHLDYDFPNSLAVGDLVQIVGQTGNHNGLSQVAFIKDVKILEPADYPEIKKAVIQSYSLDDLEDQLDRIESDLTGPLQDKDNAIVKFTAPFKFKAVHNRDGKDIGFAGFDLTGAKHTNVILEGTTSTGTKFDVKLSINYHMGTAEQTKFKTWLQEHENDDIYFLGPLSAYNELVLGPYEFDGPYGPALATTLQ